MTDNTKNAFRIALYLAGASIAATGYALLHTASSLQGGLGWAIRPGPWLLFGIVLFGISAFIKRHSLTVPLTLALFMAAIFVEYLPISATLISFIGMFFVLLGDSVLISRHRITFVTTMLMLVGSYIEAVFIYDLITPGQAMHFFRPGWTF